ncbi:antitoxin VbhA family protein [Undibacterium terreum]|uniref:Antitoxin VbhA domain-containing protein n=1 Tax=Undibacterium terreum TaxID=1224302 RepID=A0A916XMN3_9BURK|nr:antitoxin VbhA family protein [Undibacterium terreum]GGC84668.1 hypothetical protein GCM10011396_34980 [Undibacterium terreum]
MDAENKITVVEMRKRADSIMAAEGSLRLEGFVLPAEAQKINRQYINGEIDLQQHIEAMQGLCAKD